MPTGVGTVFGLTAGGTIVAAVFGFSLVVSSYHSWAHVAPLLPSVLGQASLFAATLVFGLVGYHALTDVEAPRERTTIGLHAGTGYGIAGLTSGGYAYHQYLTPETAVGFDVILFQATFVALVGGTAGVVVGLERARRERTVDDLEATTRQLGATKAEIRTEKQRFESLFQNAPSAIADLQYTGTGPTVQRANAAFEDLLVRGSADVEGENLFEVVPLREAATEDDVAPTSRETRSTKVRSRSSGPTSSVTTNFA